MDLPPSAAPRRHAPPQGRLCGRSPASSQRRRGASLVAVPAGAPVSVARPRPCPKGTTAPGKPAPCVSRASPDPGRRPSTRRTVRPRRGPGAGGTRRQPSPARPAVAGYGISPRSRCGLPEPRGSLWCEPCYVRLGIMDGTAAFSDAMATAAGAGTRYRSVPVLHCRSGRFVRRSCSPFPAGLRHPRGFPALSLGNRGTGPPDRKGRRGRGGISPGTPAPAPRPRSTPSRTRSVWPQSTATKSRPISLRPALPRSGPRLLPDPLDLRRRRDEPRPWNAPLGSSSAYRRDRGREPGQIPRHRPSAAPGCPSVSRLDALIAKLGGGRLTFTPEPAVVERRPRN